MGGGFIRRTVVWSIILASGALFVTAGCGGPGRKLATPEQRQVYDDLQAAEKKKDLNPDAKITFEDDRGSFR